MKLVKHTKKEEWGIGEILDINGYKVTVDFINVGVKLLNSKIAILEEILDEGEISRYKEDKLILTLNNKKVKKSNEKESFPLEDLIKVFLSVHKNGFLDSKYIQLKRSPKEKISYEFKKHFSKENLNLAIKDKNFSNLCDFSKKLISASKDIHSIEKTNFRKAISVPENQEQFIKVLEEFFYNEIKSEEDKFLGLRDYFDSIKCNKWTLITYFMNMMNPDKYIFLKPKVSKKASEIFSFDLNYNMTPNWNTYYSMLKFSEILKKNLQKLKPRDYIDLECFMCCVVDNIKQVKDKN